jgi:hypothetical protein
VLIHVTESMCGLFAAKKACLPDLLSLAMLAFASLAGTGCESPLTCQMGRLVPPKITVANGATGDPICDATVLLTYGPEGAANDAGPMFSATTPVSIEAGAPFGPFEAYPADGGNCAYNGTGSNLATGEPYTIVVQKSGFGAVRVSNVMTAVVGCSDQGMLPSPQEVHVVLEPQ